MEDVDKEIIEVISNIVAKLNNYFCEEINFLLDHKTDNFIYSVIMGTLLEFSLIHIDAICDGKNALFVDNVMTLFLGQLIKGAPDPENNTNQKTH